MTTNRFVPRIAEVVDITQAVNPVVTLASIHDFVIGEILSFRVSKEFGMFEMNNKEAKVLAHDDFTVTIDLETTTFSPFINAGPFVQNPALAVPSSSGVIPGSTFSVPRTTLEDVFDNLRIE